MTYQRSDHCDGRVFYNIDRNAAVDKNLFDILRWRATSKVAEWPKWLDNTHTPALPTAPVQPGQVAVTHVNHASDLVQLPGLTVITDPVFAERVSPFTWVGPKRVRPPGIALEALPALDAVVVSHNHYDHMDMVALQALHARFKPLFIVPLGNKAPLEEAGLTRVVELDWWQAHTVADDKVIMLVPAQHWSARGVTDRCRTLWGGYVLRSGTQQVFFAGDTGYGPHFKLIAERYGPMDVALLPIGAYEPRWFMHAQHMNPEDAVHAHQDLQAKQSLGIHWGTFQLTDESIDAPSDALRAALVKQSLPEATFVPLANGQTWSHGF